MTALRRRLLEDMQVRQLSPHTQRAYQSVVKVSLHSAGAASALPALFLGRILPVYSLVSPGQTGASPPSVRRATFTTDC